MIPGGLLANMWGVFGSEVRSLLGTEDSREKYVKGLLVDKPFEFGKNIGLYGDKLEAPPVINTQNANASVTDNFKASLMDMTANAGQDSEIFRKNLPSNLFEIAEGGIDIAMNPIKTGKAIFGLGSGFATKAGAFPSIDNTSNEEMATFVYDSAKQFFQTEGALRKAALEHPADVVAMIFGGAWGINKLRNLSPERLATITDQVRNIGALPVGLSMKDVSSRQLAKVDDAGFYLKSEQLVLDEAPPVLPKEQLRGWFEKRHVSQEEMTDLGLLAMFDAMPDKSKITKQGLLDHIEENRVGLKQTSLTYDTNPDAPDEIKVLDAEREYGYLDNSIDAGSGDILDGSSNSWEIEPFDDDSNYEYGRELLLDALGDTTAGLANITTNTSTQHNLKKWVDETNPKIVAKLHEMSPDLYPETSSMRLSKLNDEIKRLQSPEMRVGGQGWTSDAEKNVKEEFASLQASIMDRARLGEDMEWDEVMLSYFGDAYTPDWTYIGSGTPKVIDNVDNTRLQSDLEDIAVELGQENYLENPYFKINVDTQNGNYIVRGNSELGYTIESPEGAIIESDINDIPDVQLAIDQDNLDHGFGYDPEHGNQATRWHDYTQFDGSGQGGTGGTNYTEELIILEGNKFSNSHNPDYKGIISHLRKTHRAEYVDGSDFDPENIWYIEELQSDFHQQNRQYGYTPEQTKIRINDTRDKIKTALRGENILQALEDHLEKAYPSASAESGLELANQQLALHKTGELGTQGFDEKGLSGINNQLLFEAFQAPTAAWRNLQRKGKDVYDDDKGDDVFTPYTKDEMAQWQTTVDSYRDGWKLNSQNPESPNFQGWDEDTIQELKRWFKSESNNLVATKNKMEKHEHDTKAPLKNERYVHNAFKYAVAQAIKEGKDTVVWTPAYMQTNMWGEGTTNRGVPGQKNLYEKLYNKTIPNFAKKFAKKYGLGNEVEKIMVNMDNQPVAHLGLRITPKMIEAMRKEFPDESWTTKAFLKDARGDDKKSYDGFAQEMYAKFPIPITGGLLATQGEEDNRTGLLENKPLPKLTGLL